MSNIYVLGSVNMDMVITTPYVPVSGETLHGSDFFLNPGGKGANQAVAAGKQGVVTYLIGNVGTDVFGKSMRETLNNYHVDTTYLGSVEGSSGVAMIIICDHDNRIILDSGANAKVTSSQIEESLKNAKENDIFITQLENNIDAVYEGLKAAHDKKMITIFNPAPAKQLDKAVFNNVDYLVVNESECEIMTSIYPENNEKAYEAYQYLKSLGVSCLIITLGSKGALCFKDDEMIQVKAHKINAVDTTAAGDTFVGTLASKLANQASLKEALDYASLCSAMTCLKKGAQQAIPTKEEVENYKD